MAKAIHTEEAFEEHLLYLEFNLICCLVYEKKDGEYPWRALMLDDLMHHDSIRALNQNELISLLGEPTRINENHLYYRIDESSLGNWTLHTQTLVIKYADEDSLVWMKIHQ